MWNHCFGKAMQTKYPSRKDEVIIIVKKGTKRWKNPKFFFFLNVCIFLRRRHAIDFAWTVYNEYKAYDERASRHVEFFFLRSKLCCSRGNEVKSPILYAHIHNYTSVFFLRVLLIHSRKTNSCCLTSGWNKV